MDLLSVFIIAGVTAAAGVLVTAVQSFIKSRMRSRGDAFVKALPIILEGIDVNAHVGRTLLEVAKGNCNGNVEAAIGKLDVYQEKKQKYLIDQV